MNPNPDLSESMTSVASVAAALGRTLSTMLLNSLLAPPAPKRKKRADSHHSKRQLEAVRALMADGEWRTLEEIRQSVRGTEAGISARLRDLRKKQFGGLDVQRRRDASGLHWYRIGQEEAWEASA